MLKNKLIFLFLFLPAVVFAQNNEPALKLDFPLFDLPYQIDAMDTVGHGFFSSYANPSMAQSLAVAVNVHSSFHFGMVTLFNSWNWNFYLGWWNLKTILLDASLVLGDVLLSYTPGGWGWMHEEHHRAILTRYGVSSFNDMNTFPLGNEYVTVNSVTDEDLIRFKAESPADFVRAHEAGVESHYLIVDRLQRNAFFYNQELRFYVFNLFVTWNAHQYIFSATHSKYNGSDVDIRNMKETSISSRDYTGDDIAAWAYDLFRPNEPYDARGLHPTGEGIDRYRKASDLSKDEADYIRLQRYWHSLNYISPMLWGIDRIVIGDTGFYGNFAFRHLLTSFGTTASFNLFLKKDIFNMVFIFHNHMNYDNWFPAVEAELLGFPVSVGPLNLYISPRIIIGMQPKNQNFKTDSSEFLGLAGCRVDFNISRYFLPYIEVAAKTNGWVAGNEFLGKNISCRLGVSARI